jgi:hypothetical protein
MSLGIVELDRHINSMQIRITQEAMPVSLNDSHYWN